MGNPCPRQFQDPERPLVEAACFYALESGDRKLEEMCLQLQLPIALDGGVPADFAVRKYYAWLQGMIPSTAAACARLIVQAHIAATRAA